MGDLDHGACQHGVELMVLRILKEFRSKQKEIKDGNGC